MCKILYPGLFLFYFFFAPISLHATINVEVINGTPCKALDNGPGGSNWYQLLGGFVNIAIGDIPSGGSAYDFGADPSGNYYCSSHCTSPINGSRDATWVIITLPDCGTCSGGGVDGADGGTSGPKQCGMPVWSVSEPYISLWVEDEPLGYQPALGSRISLGLAYKQREFSAGLHQNLFSLGRRWNFEWFSYVSQDVNGNNTVHFGGGRYRTFNNGKDYITNTQLTGNPTTGFTVVYPDGRQDVYDLIVTNSSGTFLQAFLTERWNAQSQKTRFIYSSWTPSDLPVIRLVYVIDGDGRATSISYTSANSFGTNLISQVTDPFGRSASFLYDTRGFLTNITDVAGLSTFFIYDQNNWITNMTTPYGTNSFVITDTSGTNVAPNGRSILVTEPDGGQELYLYQDYAIGISNSYNPAQVPSPSPFTTNSFDNADLNVRNTFHWGRLQYQHLSTTTISSFTNTDFILAHMKHWFKSDDTGVIETLSMEREPSQDVHGGTEGQRIWYDYDGQTNSEYAGTQVLPLMTALVLPDGTTRFVRTERNTLGLPVRTVQTYAGSAGIAYRTNWLTYYSGNNIDLLTVTNALNVQVSSNSYNAYHEVLTNYNAVGEKTVYTYNGNQQLTSVSLPSALVTTNFYFTSGVGSNELSTSTDYAVIGGSTLNYRTNSFTWANDLIATHTDARGLTTTNTWDNLQRLTRIDFPDSTSITNYYTNLDLLLTLDRMGFPNSFGYDSVRRLVAATNANGAITRYGYCTCGALQAVTNAFGTAIQQVTQYGYDNQGNILSTTGPDGYSVNYSYNLMRQATNIADSISSITNWFNNQGLLIASSNSFGQVSSAVYDILDRAVTTFDANSVSNANTFDNLNRLLSRQYPDGGIETFGYTLNFAGVTSYTNQLNAQVAKYGYDPLGRKTNEVYSGISTNLYAYRGDDLVTLTDGNSHSTTWNYDQYGRTTNKVDATGTEILRFLYDPDTRMTNRWSKQKGTTLFTYDAVGNNTGITHPVSPSITFQYDLLNRLTNMTDGLGTTLYAYNNANQLLNEDGPWTDDTISYGYNNRLRSSLSLLAPNASAWTESYTYDNAKRLKTLSSAAGTFTYTYDPTRNLQVGGLALPNGALITNNYDSVSRLLSTALKNSSGTTLNSHVYGYDSVGRRTWLTNVLGDYRNFSYDNIGEVTGVVAKEASASTNRWQEQLGYTYDPAGNLTWRTNYSLTQHFVSDNLNQLSTETSSGTMTVAGTTTTTATNVMVWGTSLNWSNAVLYVDATWARTNVALPNGSATYSAAANDNLGRTDTNTVSTVLSNSVGFLYDANGNLTNDGLRSFSYDDENQLTSVIVTNGVGNSTRSDFAYDGRMRRRSRTEYTWSSGNWVRTATVAYVYDGNLVIQERDGNNVPSVTYTRGRDLSGNLQGAGGIGGLLARTDHRLLAVKDSGAHAYYHADGGGNITALINTNQFLVAKYLYDAFGNILSQSGPLASANLYRFSSKEQHLVSALSYYLYRLYDPNLQRWANRDPSGEAAGINLYDFVLNQPTDLADVDGRGPVATTIIGSGASLETGAGAATISVEGATSVTVAGAGTTTGTAGLGLGGTTITVTGSGAGTTTGVALLSPLAAVTGAVVVGGAIGYGASQLPVVGGGTVADFYGDVIYNVFYSKPVPSAINMARHESGHENEYSRAAQEEAQRTGQNVCDILAAWMRAEKCKGRNADSDVVRKIKEAQKLFGCRHRGGQ